MSENYKNVETVNVPKIAIDTYNLTTIQKQVLTLCSQGFSDDAIAKKLDIELSTVRFHFVRLYNKFNIVNETSTIRRLILATKWLKLTNLLSKKYKNALDM